MLRNQLLAKNSAEQISPVSSSATKPRTHAQANEAHGLHGHSKQTYLSKPKAPAGHPPLAPNPANLESQGIKLQKPYRFPGSRIVDLPVWAPQSDAAAGSAARSFELLWTC